LSCSGPNVIRVLCAGTNASTQRPNSGAVVGCVFSANTPSTSSVGGVGYQINFVRPDAATAANENSVSFGGSANWDISGNVFTGLVTGGLMLRGSFHNIAGNIFNGGTV